MARKLRVEFGGACYHVINRGNYRRNLFADRGAARSFLTCLEETCRRFHWRLHAFVIMRNHFHLAVETLEPNLSVGMKWLQGTWAARFNRFRHEVGRPFQGRYKALHVEPGHALAQVAHYIHLNPVRAKAVAPERVADFPWSSLPLFIARERPKWLDARTVLRESGTLADRPAGWRCYVANLAVLAENDPATREEKFGRVSRGWVIGSQGFGNEIKGALAAVADRAAPLELLGADRTAHQQARALLWEDTLRGMATAFGTDLDKLPRKKSAIEKVRLAAALKAATSVSNRWLAERLQMGKTTSIGALIRAFRLNGGTESRAFQTVLSRFTT